MPIPQIKAFPQDDFYWRIDWIDDPLNSPDSEPRVKVYLSRLADDYISSSLRPLNNSSLYEVSKKLYAHKVIYLKVGLIQILDIGSVWRNGFRQLETESTFINEEIEFNLMDTEQIPLTKHGKFGRKDNAGNTDWQEILTEYQYRLSSQEILKGK